MKINERKLIEGLSYALDVAEKSYFSHSKHVAYAAYMIASEIGLSADNKKDLYYSAMLHDIGAGDYYDIRKHCQAGKKIVLALPVEDKLAEFVLYHHEFYDGSGPFGKKGTEIPIESQIICFANTFDIHFSSIRKNDVLLMDQISQWIESKKRYFRQEIIDAFVSLTHKEFFLLDYFNHDFNPILNEKIKVESRYLDYDFVEKYAYAFSEIIDNRSHFTYRHSIGIAELALKMSQFLEYDENMQHEMYIAGLLHDIGKLIVPTDIIEKPGPLTTEERYEINKHTYYTRLILQQVKGFERITEIAANHHEKLNGSGYPLHCTGDMLGQQERIMGICDIYQALTESRPYRIGMEKSDVWRIMDTMVEKGEIDAQILLKAKQIL
ncbi:HD-GYP domain-containing protein [Anaeromicropila herbilytica]|uniref:HDIG domain-containing protein n=1 Tax=Anaeromicropila herbilytica TaxID=2785025 RepID=A0A7R7IDC7_9FIRM|nr:HD domain-containing phosphohydrolase [Anaeromicropila herbilytica]BCN30801.1 HDIG domain-containing protein [Anaeromicropila herbilytica]